LDYTVLIYREETKRVYSYLIPGTDLVNNGKRSAGREAFWACMGSDRRNDWLVQHQSLKEWNLSHTVFWPENLLGTVRNITTGAFVHVERVPDLELDDLIVR